MSSVNLLTKLKQLGRRLAGIGDRAAFAIGIVMVAGMFVLFPLSLPAVAAATAKTAGWLTFAVGGLFYLIIWLIAAFGVMDCAAYIYDFQRPFVSARPSRQFFTLGDSKVKSRLSFVVTPLVSYALTLYGFSIAYTLISNLDPMAFKEGKPLSFITSVYFTVSTAATVGFGDISPISTAARVVTAIEMLVSTFYLIFIFSTVAGFARIAASGKRH